MRLNASSDRRAFVDDQVVEGDMIVTRWHTDGTHTGVMFGVPATGKRFVVSGISICRVVDGRIAEEWECNTAPQAVSALSSER
jgi:predicted ester cyclase